MSRTVLLVDGNPDVLELLRVLFEVDERCAAVRAVSDVRDAVWLASSLQPDVVVVDPVRNGVLMSLLVSGLRIACPRIVVVAFVSCTVETAAGSTCLAGADTVLAKGEVRVADVVEVVLAGIPRQR